MINQRESCGALDDQGLKSDIAAQITSGGHHTKFHIICTSNRKDVSYTSILPCKLRWRDESRSRGNLCNMMIRTIGVPVIPQSRAHLKNIICSAFRMN